MVWSGSEKSDQLPVTRKQTKEALLLSTGSTHQGSWFNSHWLLVLKPSSIFSPSNVTWTECYHYHTITFYLPSSGGWWRGTGHTRCRRWTSTPLPHLRGCQCEDNHHIMSWCMIHGKKDWSLSCLWLDQHKCSHVESGSQISMYVSIPTLVWPTEAETIVMATVNLVRHTLLKTEVIWWRNSWSESKKGHSHEFSNAVANCNCTITVP